MELLNIQVQILVKINYYNLIYKVNKYKKIVKLLLFHLLFYFVKRNITFILFINFFEVILFYL